MKKTCMLCRMICILLILLLAVPSQATSDGIDMSVTRGCHSIDAQMPMLTPEKKVENVYSAFLYDNTNDTLLYAQEPDLQLPPASFVKIMTALIVAERGDMDEQITVRQEVLDTLSSSSMSINLKDGEIISMRDLLYCILVEAANEAAAVAATHICGDQETFVKEMNAYAAQLGCTATVFTNVHGLHDDFQLMSARDAARILSAATKNEVFMEAFSTVNYTVPATNLSEARELSSNNYLMNDDIMTVYLDSRVTGGRAGVMATGERNLAVTAERNDVQLISIVMGSLSTLAPNGHSVVTFGSYQETSALLDMGFRGHRPVQLFYENQALKQYEVINGDSYITTGVLDAVLAVLPNGVTYNDLSYRYNEDSTTIYAPVKAGDIISTVQVWHNELCLAQANLYALHDVDVKEIVATEEIVEEKEMDTSALLIVVAVIVGLLMVLLFGRRLIFRMIRAQQIRRHRKNRRRSR